MKIRNALQVVFLSVISLGALVAEEKKVQEFIHFNLMITDQNKKPVNGSSVKVFNYTDEDSNQPKGKTSNEGLISIFSKKSLLVEVSVDCAGYYPVRSLVVPKSLFRPQEEEPETFQVVLKKVNKPIALYAKNVSSEGSGPLTVPIQSEKVGYDFLAGDWVAPHGKGKVRDLIFFDTLNYVNDTEYSRKIEIQFSNEKDGLIPFEVPLHKGSVFTSSYQAPQKGYLDKWNQIVSRVSGGGENTRTEERNFYFRVRTKLDKDGNIESAHYGKIYGDFMSFIYYFNPTSNDRNVEFNTEKNLFQNLHWKAKVDRP